MTREIGPATRGASRAVHGERREEKERRRVAEESEAGGKLGERSVVDLATLDGRKIGIALHDGNDTAGELREGLGLHYCGLCRTGRSMGEERERD